MTLLSTVQRAAILCVQDRPSSAASSDLPNPVLLTELARIDAEELAERIDWPQLLTEATFTTVASVAQASALPADFARFPFRKDDRGAIYDVARKQGIAGPATEEQWRTLTNGYSGWTASFRIFGDVLQMAPAPSAGLSMSLTYITTKLYRDVDGVAKDTWSADTDTCRIPENVIALGVRWRWKQSKGFDYAEDMRSAEEAIARASGVAAGGRRMLVVGRSRLRGDTPYDGTLGGSTYNDVVDQF
ncbi:MAG: hypothetical protein JWR61_5868 [Ferruginibacter sp.]|uniref:phage adaptor protein n=1 Tax=Ferruginibacter sp. TaxID=1940288 RepID=UPI00265A37CD|nr:hypothetical protein [Ferruginibacter sp.]MDB5280913.1 hypothetical protein [Ferruginibacter sp.]